MIVTEFKGNSGSKVFLLKENNLIFVRKIGNVTRNFERLSALEKEGYPVCKVLNYTTGMLDIEYIHGVDMCSYLIKNKPYNLTSFLIDILSNLSKETKFKNYNSVYELKLNQINYKNLPFTSNEILSKLPKELPSSSYFGDLTLENIVYNEARGFVLIDPATTEYDSFIFDIAKLKQDIVCKWFLRNKNINLDSKLQEINSAIDSKFGPLDSSLLLAMLLRVYNYTENDKKSKIFLEDAMRLIWK